MIQITYTFTRLLNNAVKISYQKPNIKIQVEVLNNEIALLIL